MLIQFVFQIIVLQYLLNVRENRRHWQHWTHRAHTHYNLISSILLNNIHNHLPYYLVFTEIIMNICNCRTRVMKVKGTGSVVRAIQQLLLIDYFTH